MDPSKSPLNQPQKARLESIMNTSTNSSTGQNPTQPANQSPAQQTPPSTPQAPVGTPPNQPATETQQPISASSLGSATPPPSATPLGTPPVSPADPSTSQPTYQAPTIGVATPAGIGAPTTQSQPELKPSKNKPMKAKSGPPMTILYVIGGIILIVVYTVIWAVVFDLQLPFGISLPF